MALNLHRKSASSDSDPKRTSKRLRPTERSHQASSLSSQTPRQRREPSRRAAHPAVSGIYTERDTKPRSKTAPKPRQSQSMPRSGRGGQIEMSSVRVGDLRRQSAHAPSNPPSIVVGPWVKWIGLALLVVVLLAVAGGFLYNSRMFAVTQVHVTGAHHLTDAEVSELAAVPADSTLLRVDTKGIEQRLESNAWVLHANVVREFPDTLTLSVEERTITAVVSITSTSSQAEENWAIASDGTWLMNIPQEGSVESQKVASQVYTDAASVLHISDVPYGVTPEVGTKCTNESVNNALNIVASLTTDLKNQVADVSATDTANTLLTLTDGVQIAFGDASDIRNKERVVLALLEEHPGKISYINVRTASNPTYRSLS